MPVGVAIGSCGSKLLVSSLGLVKMFGQFLASLVPIARAEEAQEVSMFL